MPLVPTDWLAEYVDLPENITAAQLAEALVKVGLEEEEIHPPQVRGPLVVGKVLTRTAKEQKNGKIINYCRVDVGEHNDAPGTGKEPSELASRGIICGAHNFEVGDYVVVCLPGAVLPGNFEISARKTYGHLSDGMICSVRELGIGEDHDGILVLAHSDAEAAAAGLPAIGSDVRDFLGIAGEVLEINVTPDRGYCFAMRGVAREYSHSTGAKFVDYGKVENLSQSLPEINNAGFAVEVIDENPIHGKIGCDRFVTRIVRGINPEAESPEWLKKRLRAAGMRPISLAVDATNYVMLDLGQPLHAYDLDKLQAPLVVRRARAGEMLTTLDGVERQLDVEDLLITDSTGGKGQRVVGLAGTMGGYDTEITESTRNVLIEAAHFEAISIARTARRHKLPSEASKRYERGVDPQIAPIAAQKVADLLVEYGGGEIAAENFEFNEVELPQPLVFPTQETGRLTGLELSAAQQIEMLEKIGCQVEKIDETADSGATLQVTPPSWRPDLVGSAHLVEEIVRLYGYERIPVVEPAAAAGNGLQPFQRAQRDIARSLAEQGWVQVLSYPFVSAANIDRQEIPATDCRRQLVRLRNPLQEEAPYMRSTILDSLLDSAHLNVARGNPQVAIFEMGVVTRPGDLHPAANPGAGAKPTAAALAELQQAIPQQPLHVAGIACGEVANGGAGFTPVYWDWRAAVETGKEIGRLLGLEITVANATYAPYHPGRCAQLRAAGEVIGYAGELAPRICKACEIPARSIAFEIDLDAAFRLRSPEPLQVAPVATFPPVKEDIAVVVDKAVPAADLEQIIREAAGELLEEVKVFDLYTGDQIPAAKKSLAFALRFRSPQRTLEAADIAGLRKRILQKLARKAGAELRGK